MDVSSRNVENVIRKVLKVVGVSVDRLAKATILNICSLRLDLDLRSMPYKT